MEEKSVIKSVFCSYRGSLIVYDVHGNRVDHLCDKMTLEIYNEIEERSMEGITTFDGLEKYRCVVCELKEEELKEEEEREERERANSDPSFDPFNQPKINSRPIIHTNGNILHSKIVKNVVIGDIWCDDLTGIFRQWDGNSWNIMTATGGILTGGPPQPQQPTAPYSPFGVITPYSNPNK